MVGASTHTSASNACTLLMDATTTSVNNRVHALAKAADEHGDDVNYAGGERPSHSIMTFATSPRTITCLRHHKISGTTVIALMRFHSLGGKDHPGVYKTVNAYDNERPPVERVVQPRRLHAVKACTFDEAVS